MPRESVTYEQVAAAADELAASGVKEPGAKAVREVLAARTKPGDPIGSPNTIQRHLAVWRRDRPVSLVDNPTLPHALAGDLARAISMATETARGESAAKLAQLDRELADLTVVGERAEAQIEALQLELRERTSERDRAQGQLAEQMDSGSLLRAEVERLTSCLKTRETALTVAERAALVADARVSEIQTAAAADRETARHITEELQSRLAASQQIVASAGERAAGAEGRVDELKDAKRRLEAQVSALTENVAALTDEARRAAAAEAEAASLRDQVKLLETTNAMFKQLLQKAGALSN